MPAELATSDVSARPGRLAATATALIVSVSLAAEAAAQSARISEAVRTIETYAFSEPNPVPILTRDTRLYPYHSFEGYEATSAPREWKVVHLENDLIEVWVLPEIGGKVWGARVKATGHEFIYRNEVVKFRNIALRGPWTSGGIEFNFGVIGHAPSTATPVDYFLRDNSDGSVSCIVGGMDLPSRTEWRVEIRLPADRASFETNVLWHNPTPLEQPYYNWMTAAAFATDDLELSIPGNAYLQHSGERESWPVDEQNRYLPLYRNNAFAGNKSFHVVGELNDFFGGYYLNANYGFGHWARYEDMPGQKLWLWALSRAGGIWEDLLTDTDGQYVEFQAGRLLVQYSPGAHVNPITQAGFDPVSTDRWTEVWFPVEGIGGLTDASRDGAMSVREDGDELVVGVHAFGNTSDTLRIWAGDELVSEQPLDLAALQPFVTRVRPTANRALRIELRALGLEYVSDPSSRALSRPFETETTARPSIPEADRLVFEGRELVKARRYADARPLFESARAVEPWHREASLGLADLEFRRARYAEGLVHVRRVLQLDAYDAQANFVAGTLYRALGRVADARDAFGWAARSVAYRSAANVQLAELALARQDLAEARRYAGVALDHGRFNLSAWEVLGIVGRKIGERGLASPVAAQLLEIDPLHHFVGAEAYLSNPSSVTAAALLAPMRGEYPEQTLLELAIGYANRGLAVDAMALLDATAGRFRNPLLGAWLAFLRQDPEGLSVPNDIAFVFPYRRETLHVLEWAAAQRDDWQWDYLVALNLWALDRPAEAEALLRQLGAAPDLPAFYVARAYLVEQAVNGDPEPDLLRAERLGGDNRLLRIPLIQFYQRQGRWADALAASERARERFPSDFNLDLMHARSLTNLGRADEALAILDATSVLPSEHARESHQMYVQAHTIAALSSLEALEPGATQDARRYDETYAHLVAALDWPEHLGQGRPYGPEERLTRYLMGRVSERRGLAEDARAAFEAVATATSTAASGLSRVDLLAIPALASLGRTADIEAMLRRVSTIPPENGIRRMADLLAKASAAGAPGADSAAAVRDLAREYPRLFGDLEGELLVRALSLSSR